MAIGEECLLLEAKIGYKFSDVELIENAVTHSSYANEKKSQGMNISSNERLEFLGDAVLELVISDYLYKYYKNHSEGSLTKMRQHLVCEKTLSKIALKLELGKYINLGRGEEITDCRCRPKVLADTLEALIAAVYLDSKSSEVLERVVLALFKEEIEAASKMQRGDAKTMLQQLVEKDGAALLEYEVLSVSGPEHNKTFTVIAKVNNNVVGKGESKSKKDAEMKAAEAALSLFGISL
jgi:ribonuclease-3